MEKIEYIAPEAEIEELSEDIVLASGWGPLISFNSAPEAEDYDW